MLILLCFATALWVVTTVIVWINDHRKVATVSAVVGVVAEILMWSLGVPWSLVGVAVLGVLAIVCMFAVPEVFLGG